MLCRKGTTPRSNPSSTRPSPPSPPSPTSSSTAPASSTPSTPPSPPPPRRPGITPSPSTSRAPSSAPRRPPTVWCAAGVGGSSASRRRRRQHSVWGMRSKAAVEAMTKILAKELKGAQITANCVAPGPIATDMFFAGKTEEDVKRVVDICPLGRLGQTEDVAPLVGFLATDAAEWINGQVIRINGGYV